jgi:two-component system, cell cycle response regulator CpdR
VVDATLHILIVEDDASLGPLIADALAEMGYQVMLAVDGQAALEILQGDTPIDIVFSDVGIPSGMSGIDLIGHARRLRPQARCILASGYAKAQLPPLPEDIVFLAKPYRIPQLVAAFTA